MNAWKRVHASMYDVAAKSQKAAWWNVNGLVLPCWTSRSISCPTREYKTVHQHSHASH